MPSQKEYNVAKQTNRKLFVKVNLLNYNYQVVDELSGVVVGSPTFTNNSSSDIRRTCSFSFVPTDKSFDIAYGSKIWLDKYIQVFVGIEENKTKEIIYTNMGIYMIDNPSRVYSSNNNTLTIQGIDLMAKMTGLRNGNLVGLEHIIHEGTNVRTAIIGTIELAGFTKYVVEECPFDVPNEIKIDVGGTVYDILKQLLEIYPNYEMYFDVDGIFHYDMIPSGKNEQIRVSDDLWQSVLINYTINTNFDDVKNDIEVFGKTHDISYYAIAIESGNTYNLTIADVTRLRNNLKIGFTAPNKLTNPLINLNSYGAKQLLEYDGTPAVLADDTNVYYVCKYIEDGDYFLFMGEVTPHGEAQDNNPQSPFYVNGTMGKVRIVLQGGDYDNIYMSSLAKARADWELYNRCKVKDSINITCVPIYWLDVNWLVEITLPNKQGTEETNQYIIKSINTTYGVSATQTIEMMRFYPLYEDGTDPQII